MSGPGPKQRGIASFFGKPGGAKPAAAAGSGAPASSNGAAGGVSAPKSSPAKPKAASKSPNAGLRRLKKADDSAELVTAGAKRKHTEAAAAANELEDDLSDAAPAPQDEAGGTEATLLAAEAAAAGSPAAPPAASPKAPGSSPKRRKRGSPAAAAAVHSGGGSPGAHDSGAPADSDASEPEDDPDEEEEAAPTSGKKKAAKKPVKKAVLKNTGLEKRVEGVGLGSVAAAAKHETVDVKSLITWQPDSPVPFAFLAKTWEEIADESKRLAITQLLTNSLRAILASMPGDLLPTLYLCTGRVAPSHEGIELGVGDSILIKALADATGRSPKEIQKEYDQEGDLGTVAAAARGKQKAMFKPPPLTVAGVHKVFLEIARTEGNKSQDKKKALINKLLVAAGQNEAGYIMRCLQGKLRIGLAEQTVLVSLAQAALLHSEGKQAGIPKKSDDNELAGRLEAAAQAVKLAYSQCPSFDVLAPAILEHGPMGLTDTVRFQPGVPVKPMLAKPMTGVSEVLDKFADKPFTCEFKYDGERAQVHILEDGSVHVYSRNSENNTTKYPDIVASIPRLVKPGVKGLVLDCEAVAYDRETQQILPFQKLSTRARKDVKVEDITIQVCLYAFDCLYRNGETLIQRSLTERRQALYDSIEEREGELFYAKTSQSQDLEELVVFMNDSVAAGTEGLIVKSLDSTYEPSRRSVNWLKLKKDYMDSVGDTFDVVPIGAWFGKGKRKGVYGAYLLAVYNEEEEQFQTISKIGTGFSEQLLIDLAASLQPSIIPGPKPYYRYGGGTLLDPDVWFDTSQVWEVKAADLSISPRHMAAVGMLVEGKGISIRFPRLVRVREDKSPEQATSAVQVVEMYQAQAIHNTKDKKAAAADDDY